MSVGAEIILMFWDIDHNFYAVKQPFNFGVFTMCVDQGAIPDIGFDFVFFFFILFVFVQPLHVHGHTPVLTASNIPKQDFFLYLQEKKKWHIINHLHSILIICS